MNEPIASCKPLYLNYSLGLLASRSPALDCPIRHEDYIYQLIKSNNNSIANGKYTKIVIDVAPCSTKSISLENLGLTTILALLVKLDCGSAYLSLDDSNYMPLRTFFLETGLYECEDTQTIDMSEPSITDLYIKNTTKEVSSILLVVIGT